jgi:hypothetical protein
VAFLVVSVRGLQDRLEPLVDLAPDLTGELLGPIGEIDTSVRAGRFLDPQEFVPE